jgi:hypothetical protein
MLQKAVECCKGLIAFGFALLKTHCFHEPPPVDSDVASPWFVLCNSSLLNSCVCGRSCRYQNSVAPYLKPRTLKFERTEIMLSVCVWGQGSAVGITTRYVLEGPGIESGGRGEIFRISPDRPCCPPTFLHNGYRVFPRAKTAEV